MLRQLPNTLKIDQPMYTGTSTTTRDSPKCDVKAHYDYIKSALLSNHLKLPLLYSRLDFDLYLPMGNI